MLDSVKLSLCKTLRPPRAEHLRGRTARSQFPPEAPLRRGGVFAQAAGPGGGVVDAGETWGPGRSLRSLHPTYLLLSCYAKVAGANRIIYTIRPPHLNGVFVNWVEKVYTETYVSAENNDSYTQYSGMMPDSGAGGP